MWPFSLFFPWAMFIYNFGLMTVVGCVESIRFPSKWLHGPRDRESERNYAECGQVEVRVFLVFASFLSPIYAGLSRCGVDQPV